MLGGGGGGGGGEQGLISKNYKIKIVNNMLSSTVSSFREWLEVQGLGMCLALCSLKCPL